MLQWSKVCCTSDPRKEFRDNVESCASKVPPKKTTNQTALFFIDGKNKTKSYPSSIVPNYRHINYI
jgi:hypothetical protein